jgi:glycosyltransferase involved in cell wall biosynthesis
MTICIAHVNVARGYRGGERQTELLVRELAAYDVRQVLVARRDQPLCRRLNDVDVDVRTVSGQLPGVVSALQGADLVHIHEGRSVYAAYVRSILSRTPYLITRRVNNPIRNHWFARHAYRRAVYVAAVAPQVADVVAAYDSRIRLKVVHSGSSGLIVDPEFSTAVRNAYPGKYLVGHVGALDNGQKAQELIIEVARQFQDSHPNIHFLLVGGGEDEAMLKAAARGLENLEFIGFVENVGDFLGAFDLFILPSRKEGIGSILLDAMEQGLPIVASRVGGVPEVVHDRENGLLIDSERPDQLAAGILEIHDSPDLAQTLGSNGKNIATHYTAAVMCKKYLALYESVLGPIRTRNASADAS